MSVAASGACDYSPTESFDFSYQVKPINVKDRTEEFVNLTNHLLLSSQSSSVSLRSLILALLSKPKINANKIAYILLPGVITSWCPARTQCFELLIKLHYDLSGYFQGLDDDSVTKVIEHVLISRTAIQITDLIACGLDLSIRESIGKDVNSNFSFLIALLCKPYSFYETGQFEGYHPATAPFSSEQLDTYGRDFITEADVTQFLRDLIFNCNLDLTILLEDLLGSSLPIRNSTGSAISLFRELATSPTLPPHNAFQVVLNEYDGPSALGDCTEDFVHLTNSHSSSSLERLAHALLSKSPLNANKIAHNLLLGVIGRCPGRTQCFELLIKFHYDLSDYFKGLDDYSVTKVIEHVLVSRTAITITDLIACGMDLSAKERRSEDSSANFSCLIAPLNKPYSFYEERQFVGYIPVPGPFCDKQFVAYERDEISELDVILFLQDLIFNCNLDLKIPLGNLSASWLQPIRKSSGTAIDLFRELATSHTLPSKNAFKEALDEYDEANKQTAVKEYDNEIFQFEG